MQKEYCERIRRNLVYLVDKMELGDIETEIKARLILTKRMLEHVQSEKLSYKKNQLFFDMLEKRPDEKFFDFVRILRENHQEHIANLLDPGQLWVTPQATGPPPQQQQFRRPVQASDNSLDFHMDVREGPSSAANNMGDTKPSKPRDQLNEPWPGGFLGQLKNLNINVDETDLENDDGVYPMLTKPRGKCLIVNNVDFTSMPRRNGSDVDAHNLQLLFHALDFIVIEYKNLRKVDFVKRLHEFSAQESHKESSCVVLVVLSHGSDGHVYSVDGDTIPVSFIVQLFDGKRCPQLIDKPKIFILQACRGEKFDPGVSGDHVDARSDTVTDAKQMKRDLEYALEESTVLPKCLPTMADILLAYATLPGYVSWRNSERGSWFIQAIVQIFRDNAHREHLADMLTMVNDKVATAFQSSTGSYKSMPQPVSMLRKKLYFFPKKNA